MTVSKDYKLNGRHICFLVPAYDGQVPIEFMVSYVYTERLMAKHGVKTTFETRVGCALIDKARNELVHSGITNTDATDFMLIDSDISWSPESVLRLLCWSMENEGINCGMYPVKQDDPKFYFSLARRPDGTLIQNEMGLLQAEGAPTGFMMVSRKALAKMEPHLETYVPKRGTCEGQRVTLYFQCALHGDLYFGEDIEFCNRAVRCKVPIWIDPAIDLMHIGRKIYDHTFRGYLESSIQAAKETQSAA